MKIEIAAIPMGKCTRFYKFVEKKNGKWHVFKPEDIVAETFRNKKNIEYA